MDLKQEAQRRHAEFPWLSLDEPEGVAECLRAQGILSPEEAVLSVSKAGEGNMNLTLRVETASRSIVLKQARPWVEKYDHIPAPWDRILFEQRYYERIRGIEGVASMSPQILGVDAEARTIAMEFLEDASDFVGLYEGDAIGSSELSALAVYLRALHESTRDGFDPTLANREMRALNHEHMYVIPYAGDNGLELDGLEPGLDAAATALRLDTDAVDAARLLGERYLEDGACLLHGDFYPGSWLQSARGLVVIDPEFCFFGDAEFDLGIAIAHMALAAQPESVAAALLSEYGLAVDIERVSRYAGAEIIRRLVGVAQLPIPPTVDFRVPLLARGRAALTTGDLNALWST